MNIVLHGVYGYYHEIDDISRSVTQKKKKKKIEKSNYYNLFFSFPSDSAKMLIFHLDSRLLSNHKTSHQIVGG